MKLNYCLGDGGQVTIEYLVHVLRVEFRADFVSGVMKQCGWLSFLIC
jgi:hypothetical protein